MDLQLSDDQEFFRETTRKYLESECGLSVTRSLADNPDGFDPAFWSQGADLGWTSMLVSENNGGGSLSGAGLLDLAIIAEEIGRMVAPGPLIPCSVVADTINAVGTADQQSALLPGLVAGSAIAAWAFAEPGTGWSGDQMRTTATADGDGYVINGVKTPVEAATQAGWLLITAQADAGPTNFLIAADSPGVTIAPLDSLDLVKRFGEVRLVNVAVDSSAVVGPRGQADWHRALQVAAVLQCAEANGAAERVLEFTLEYVGDRYSFGRPLSSYQALKHRFASMKMWIEGCHAITDAAAAAVQRNAADAAELVSAAKSYVGSQTTELIQDCVQMHGGIGVTWEHDIHLYLRRATLGRGLYGSPADHRELLATGLGMGPAAA